MARKVADCREMPSESGCTLTIAGEEDEVVRQQPLCTRLLRPRTYRRGPELMEQIRSILKDE